MPDLRLGYLAPKGGITEELLQKMVQMGFYEICPHAEDVNEENVAKWHALGLDVRAWGVANETLMRQVYDSGADGMTVNFPDKLTAYIARDL
jgi:glycerophosphoryl diester phosphodiesterase